ncbi:hypothetical protein NP210_24820, partial [Salmonella enterica]|nr:hypothetical protein [Salmonella enterica]
LLYTREIALCAGSRCNIQDIELRKEGIEKEGKPLEVQSCKPTNKKNDKRFLTQEAFLQIPCKTGSWCALRESL